MKRDLTLTEALLMAIIILLLGFLAADHTLFKAMRVEFLNMEKLKEPEGPIKFTFVDLPEDRETENPDAKLFSDISRRAAGGRGAPSNKASSRGNTPEVIIRPKPVPTQPQPSQDPAPDMRSNAEETETAPGETGARESVQSKPAPKLDVSKLFSSTDPEIYNNPEGGMIIPGNFSIDTQGFDLGPYAKKIQQIVRANWNVPQVARNLYLKGRVEVLFNIQRDGTITDVQLGTTTGFEPLDKSAEFAIRYSDPLPPLPSFIPEDKIKVKWTFYYNERPED